MLDTQTTQRRVNLRALCGWAHYYRTATRKLKMMQSSTAGAQPVRPDKKDGREVEEPADVEEFGEDFPATNWDALTAFRLDPRESLHMQGT